MQTTFKVFFSCFLCLLLTLLSGCGSGLTPAEQAEVDKYIENYGTQALCRYMADVSRSRRRDDAERVLRFVEYLVSKGADVNAGAPYHTPLYYAKQANLAGGRFGTVIEYLESKGAK